MCNLNPEYHSLNLSKVASSLTKIPSMADFQTSRNGRRDRKRGNGKRKLRYGTFIYSQAKGPKRIAEAENRKNATSKKHIQNTCTAQQQPEHTHSKHTHSCTTSEHTSKHAHPSGTYNACQTHLTRYFKHTFKTQHPK